MLVHYNIVETVIRKFLTKSEYRKEQKTSFYSYADDFTKQVLFELRSVIISIGIDNRQYVPSQKNMKLSTL